MSITTTTQHIAITPSVRGGRPHIIGRRITVAEIATWHVHQGISVDEIVKEYDLNYSDVYAALTYYCDHRDTIDASIQEDARHASEVRHRNANHIQ
jgi:uncharacterized protein (DUF433 family)